MTTRRVMLVAVVAAVVYVVAAILVFSRVELPPLGLRAALLILLATVAQIGAKWFFGLLFKESVEEAGGALRAYSAFRGALVGAGVARLIPAGGAITPVAMAWTVRDEESGTAGAAVRTVLLNYAGLLVLTGVGLLVARPRPGAEIASISLAFLAPFVLGAGLVLMFGSGKLGTIVKYLPRGLRRRLEASMINHLPDLESQAYIWGRLVLEALALGLVLHAFGIDASAFQVLAAYGVSQLAGGLPGTPGGMGVTEAGLVFILSAYGFAAATTVAPVLIFRVVSYWVPAALGFFAGGSIFLSSPEAAAASEHH